MSKSNKYGYSGVDIPTQAFKANVGKFDPDEINELVAEGKWTTFGQLELIQTQSVSSAVCDFTSLGDYDIHFLTFFDIEVTTQTEFGYRLSDDGGTTYETGYQFANQRGKASNSFQERKSTGQDSARLCGDITTASTSRASGYVYFYNLGDSAKYSFSTSHTTFMEGTTQAFEFGSQCYATASTINGIRFGEATGVTAITTGTFSLYGI